METIVTRQRKSGYTNEIYPFDEDSDRWYILEN